MITVTLNTPVCVCECESVICVCSHTCNCEKMCIRVCFCVRGWMWQCVITVPPCLSVWLGFGFLLLCTAWYCCYDLHFNEYLLKNNKQDIYKENFFVLKALSFWTCYMQTPPSQRIISFPFFSRQKNAPSDVNNSILLEDDLRWSSHYFSFCNTYYWWAWGKKKPQKKGGHIKVTPARHPLCSDERKKITFMDAASLQKV